jgi:hypothetical protein
MLVPKRPVALVALALTVVLAGCGSSGSSKVSPATYVKSVCSAIGPFEKQVQSRSSALNLSSIKSAAEGKAALHDFLSAVASDTDHAVSQLKAAGVPDVSNGKAISTGIVSAFTQVKTALTAAAGRTSSLPTANPQAFKTAAASLGAGVQASMSKIGTSLGSLKSPTLEAAAAKEPTCKSIGSG